VATGADGREVGRVPGGTNEIAFDGIAIELPVPPDINSGDSFTINPMAGAAEGMKRAISSAQDIAAANAGGGPGDNENLEEMLKIQDEKLIGDSTLSDAYSSLVGTIGDRARSVKSVAASAEIDFGTKYDAKQALSGVNMDEEYINLDMYKQYYNANAQLLQTATDMFDALLAIR
jgi:flagellar hook-associated protein 1 FlgK